MQGDGLASLALLWWIAEQTGSVALATTLSMLSMLPVIFLGPVAGVVIDRYSRRQMMMIADILRAVFSGIVAWGIITGNLQMWLLMVASVVMGICRVFHRPALQAAIAQIVPEQSLNRANSLFQLAESGANMIAPALAGVLVAWLGSGAVMTISAATCAFAAVTLLLAVIPPVPQGSAASAGRGTNGFFQELGAGLSYLWSGQRMLFFMLCTFALVNFALSPIGPLLPFVAQQRMGVDASGTGLLMSGLSAGMLGGALILSAVGSRVPRGVGVIWGIAVTGLGLAVVSQMRHLAPALAALVLAGAAVSLANVCSAGLFQTHVPKEMQGRVFAVRGSIALAASPLSLGLVGALSTAVAPHIILLVGGIIVAIGGFLGYAVPGLRMAK